MTKEIELTQGKVALVDDEDYEWLNKWEWYVHSKYGNYWYAKRTKQKESGKRQDVFMHREILGLKFGDGKLCDHINQETLDNRRSNLRIASRTVNSRNNSGYTTNTSGHVGVHWCKQNIKWRAQIKVKGKYFHIGYFNNIDDAIEARRLGEIEHW